MTRAHNITRTELSGDTRLTIGRDAIKIFAQRPLMGWGLGVFGVIYPSFSSLPTNLKVGMAHNDYLQLLVETGAQSLNRAVALMRKGVDLSKGRFRDIVGEVEVEFLPVDPKWLHHLMLRTNWYYEGADVPVLQLVFPDLELGVLVPGHQIASPR